MSVNICVGVVTHQEHGKLEITNHTHATDQYGYYQVHRCVYVARNHRCFFASSAASSIRSTEQLWQHDFHLAQSQERALGGHMDVHASIDRIRKPPFPSIHLTNAFGLNDLPITRVTVALPIAEAGQNLTGASAINTTTIQTLTFSGNESIIIPDAALAVSDPINFPLQAGQIISITMYLQYGQASNYVTSHPGSRTQIWLSFGDYTSAQNMTDISTTSTFHWFFLSAVEAWTSPQKSAFVVVGDSITDGRASHNNANGRWTDLLFNRMQTYGPTNDIAVVNQAAGGNRILTDGNGPNALGRIDRDVLAQSGIKYAMIFEGVNDIGTADNTTANQTETGDRMIQAYKQMITRVHTFGIPFFGSTITPFGAPNDTIQTYSTPQRLATRDRVNAWIRTSGAFDAVIDFDAVVRDPTNPEQLNPIYNSGDYLHPNQLGYNVMARAFPLDIFEKYQDGVSTFM
ncbi:hypothetical protein LTR02_005994 [Friedmanniomyces endolithicus]|nr:hypothetical protein LTR03_011621 [Friedmanniomyces endolithicus]KAK0906332.1 hypothetical protein LTR02_005994 [Friedmanniomyces endolithicus]